MKKRRFTGKKCDRLVVYLFKNKHFKLKNVENGNFKVGK